MEKQEEQDEFVKNLTQEGITSLFKNFLSIVGEIYDDHSEHERKLIENFPELEASIKAANCFGENKFKQVRKRVLDMGNEAIRNNARKTEQVKILFRK